MNCVLQSSAQVSQPSLTEAALLRHNQAEVPPPRPSFNGKEITVNNRYKNLQDNIEVLAMQTTCMNTSHFTTYTVSAQAQTQTNHSTDRFHFPAHDTGSDPRWGWVSLLPRLHSLGMKLHSLGTRLHSLGMRLHSLGMRLGLVWVWGPRL